MSLMFKTIAFELQTLIFQYYGHLVQDTDLHMLLSLDPSGNLAKCILKYESGQVLDQKVVLEELGLPHTNIKSFESWISACKS